jgi:hypothetical protein
MVWSLTRIGLHGLFVQIGLANQVLHFNFKLGDSKWIFLKRTFSLVQKDRVGNYFRVQNSPATLSNKLFIHTIDSEKGLVIDDRYHIEDDLVFDAVSSKDILNGVHKKIIMPYVRYGNSAIKMSGNTFKNNYPGAYQYFLSVKPTLLQRTADKRSNWYEFGRSQGLSNIFLPKILLSSVFTDKVKPTLLTSDQIPYSGFFITSISDKPLEFCLKILQSDEFRNYLISVGISMNGKSRRISVRDIENFEFDDRR